MKMYDKKSANIVEAVDFYSNGTVLIYNPNIGGDGWVTIQRKRLIPVDYAEELIKAKEKSKINFYRNRLKLIYAEWETSDGKIFSNLDEAIEYEKELMEKE